MYYDEIKKRDEEFCRRNGIKPNKEHSIHNLKNNNNGSILIVIILIMIAVLLGIIIVVIGVIINQNKEMPAEPPAAAGTFLPVITAEPTAVPPATAAPAVETAPPSRGSWENIPENVQNTMIGSSYPSGGKAEISLSQLAYLTIPYKDFNGNTVPDGHMIVAKELADDVLDIFEELYKADYPIEKMYLVDRYGASDYDSIDDNNTSAFNYRESTDGSGRLSKHALGRAIDINPQQNPYVRSNGTGSHQNAREYWSRNYEEWSDPTARRAYIGPGTKIYNIFIAHGWQWGGSWSSYRDYQHFEKN